MKSGNGKEVVSVDERLERKFGRMVRSAGEVAVITNLARELCKGDEKKAERLLHRVLFEMHDRTWGDSLHEGDPDRALVETEVVCAYLKITVESQRPMDLRKLTERAVTLATKHPHEISLYRSMVSEFCRVEDVRVFEKALTMRGGRLLPMDSEDVRIYQRNVGKSYWELDLDMLRRVFISNFMAWKVSTVKFVELEEEEVKQPEFLAEVSVFLTGLRVNLRRIARVVVAKRALSEREITKPQRIEIDVKKIRAIQIMMGETEEVDSEDDEQIDMRIDLETARQFLD